MLCNYCPDRDSNPGSHDYRSDALPIELHRHLGTKPKSLKLVANHWASEYREKTTPSRIFMPCNLSSCRVMATSEIALTSAIRPSIRKNRKIQKFHLIIILTSWPYSIWTRRMKLLDLNWQNRQIHNEIVESLSVVLILKCVNSSRPTSAKCPTGQKLSLETKFCPALIITSANLWMISWLWLKPALHRGVFKNWAPMNTADVTFFLTWNILHNVCQTGSIFLSWKEHWDIYFAKCLIGKLNYFQISVIHP